MGWWSTASVYNRGVVGEDGKGCGYQGVRACGGCFVEAVIVFWGGSAQICRLG